MLLGSLFDCIETAASADLICSRERRTFRVTERILFTIPSMPLGPKSLGRIYIIVHSVIRPGSTIRWD